MTAARAPRLRSWVFLLIAVGTLCLAGFPPGTAAADLQPGLVRADFGIQTPGVAPDGSGARVIAFDLAWAHGRFDDFGDNPIVFLDAARDSGVITTNDAVAGSYTFYPVAGGDGPAGWILKIRYAAPNVNNQAYFYAVDAARSAFAFFGLHGATGHLDLETGKPFHAALLKLVFQPERLAVADLAWLGDESSRSTQVMWGIDFMAAWLPALYRFELAANRRNPALNLTYAGCVPSCEWLSWPGAVTPDEREALAVELAEAWDRVPLAARVPFLMPFRDGGTRNTLETVGGLITDFLLRTREPALATEGWRLDQLSRVAREYVPRVLEAPALNPGLRAELIRAVAEELPEYLRMSGDDDLVIDFLVATLPGAAESTDPEEFGRLLNLRRLLLERSTMSASSLGHLARVLTPLLGADSAAPVNALVARTLERTVPEDLPMLIDSFLLPLTDVTRAALAERIMQLPSLSGGDDLPYYLQVLPADGFRRAPPDLRDRFLRSWAGGLTARYAERGVADSFHGPYDNMLSRALRVARLADGFETNAPLFLPLLRLGCPRQPDETESTYASRIARIESLWLQDRIFLHDPKGGTLEHPEYPGVFTDFASTHPGWLHLLFLALDEPGRAEVNGSAQFDWRTYSTPQLIANSLLHEGAHALDLLGDPEDPRIDELSRTWYFQRATSSRRLVSDYAATNPREFWAEHARYWYQDSRTWFQRAVDRYAEGEPGMLHVFLFLWNLGDPKDAPGLDQKALFRLRDDGLLQRDYVSAGWTSGDPKLGEFHAAVDGHYYVFQYRGGLIQSVQRDGQRVAGLAAAPTFRVPTRVDLAEDARLVLTNLVLNPEPGLELTLLEGPAGLTIDTPSNSLTWQPTAAQAGLSHVVRLRATVPGPVHRSSSLRMVVTVERRLRVAPVAPLVGPEQRTLLTQIEIADPGSTRPPLTYSVVPPRPGLDVDVSSGQVLFTPTEDDGPGERIVTIQIRDSSTPPKLTTVEILARITEVNLPPAIQPVAVQKASPGRLLRVPLVVTDPDRPANRLTFDLPVGFPAGASISEDGVVSWAVPPGTSPGRYRWTARVRDDGTPSLSTSTTLTVDVQAVPPLTLRVAAIRPGEFDLVITGESGATGELEASTDFQAWQVVAPVTLVGGTGQVTVSAGAGEPARFFRVRLP